MHDVSQKMSVMIMNWARRLNVQQFVPQYARHPAVAQVTVWDPSDQTLDTRWPNIGKVPFDRTPGDILYVRSHGDPGLYARYAMAALSPTEAVLIVDDDIELATGTIDHLHQSWLKDSAVLHGIFGRNPGSDGVYHVGHYVHGPCQVLLTRALVTSRWLAARALAWGTRHCAKLPGKPLGNGEDIVLSHVAMAESGRLNVAYNLPYRNQGFADANAISVRVPDHESHRTEVVRWCRREILGGRPLPKE